MTIYKNGHYVCGASLVHTMWLLTHASCATLCDPVKDFCIARMGANEAGPFAANTEQFRRIVSFVQGPIFIKALLLPNY